MKTLLQQPGLTADDVERLFWRMGKLFSAAEASDYDIFIAIVSAPSANIDAITAAFERIALNAVVFPPLVRAAVEAGAAKMAEQIMEIFCRRWGQRCLIKTLVSVIENMDALGTRLECVRGVVRAYHRAIKSRVRRAETGAAAACTTTTLSSEAGGSLGATRDSASASEARDKDGDDEERGEMYDAYISELSALVLTGIYNSETLSYTALMALHEEFPTLMEMTKRAVEGMPRDKDGNVIRGARRLQRQGAADDTVGDDDEDKEEEDEEEEDEEQEEEEEAEEGDEEEDEDEGEERVESSWAYTSSTRRRRHRSRIAILPGTLQFLIEHDMMPSCPTRALSLALMDGLIRFAEADAEGKVEELFRGNYVFDSMSAEYVKDGKRVFLERFKWMYEYIKEIKIKKMSQGAASTASSSSSSSSSSSTAASSTSASTSRKEDAKVKDDAKVKEDADDYDDYGTPLFPHAFLVDNDPFPLSNIVLEWLVEEARKDSRFIDVKSFLIPALLRSGRVDLLHSLLEHLVPSDTPTVLRPDFSIKPELSDAVRVARWRLLRSDEIDDIAYVFSLRLDTPHQVPVHRPYAWKGVQYCYHAMKASSFRDITHRFMASVFCLSEKTHPKVVEMYFFDYNCLDYFDKIIIEVAEAKRKSTSNAAVIRDAKESARRDLLEMFAAERERRFPSMYRDNFTKPSKKREKGDTEGKDDDESKKPSSLSSFSSSLSSLSSSLSSLLSRPTMRRHPKPAPPPFFSLPTIHMMPLALASDLTCLASNTRILPWVTTLGFITPKAYGQFGVLAVKLAVARRMPIDPNIGKTLVKYGFLPIVDAFKLALYAPDTFKAFWTAGCAVIGRNELKKGEKLDCRLSSRFCRKDAYVFLVHLLQQIKGAFETFTLTTRLMTAYEASPTKSLSGLMQTHYEVQRVHETPSSVRASPAIAVLPPAVLRDNIITPSSSSPSLSSTLPEERLATAEELLLVTDSMLQHACYARKRDIFAQALEVYKQMNKTRMSGDLVTLDRKLRIVEMASRAGLFSILSLAVDFAKQAPATMPSSSRTSTTSSGREPVAGGARGGPGAAKRNVPNQSDWVMICEKIFQTQQRDQFKSFRGSKVFREPLFDEFQMMGIFTREKKGGSNVLLNNSDSSTVLEQSFRATQLAAAVPFTSILLLARLCVLDGTGSSCGGIVKIIEAIAVAVEAGSLDVDYMQQMFNSFGVSGKDGGFFNLLSGV